MTTGHSTPDRERRLDVAVIGAGIAGLTAARTLADHGHQVVVLDKGRGPGGRTSSRHRPGFEFDHGAQYLSAREPRFRSRVKGWFQDGVVAPWTPRVRVFEVDGVRSPRGEHERFVGVPSMSAIAQHLARDLEIRSGVRVYQVEKQGTGWMIRNKELEVVAEADAVVVAIPPVQAAPLLAAAPELARQVEAVTMEPCWAVMLGFAMPLSVEFDAAFVNEGPLSWVARNSSKPGRAGGEAWVLHATAAWSARNLESDGAEVTHGLQGDFALRCAGSELPPAVHAEAHRWRFAQPSAALDAPCLFAAHLGIGVAGDWCGGPRIEGAFLSGMALAGRILDWAGDGTCGGSGVAR